MNRLKKHAKKIIAALVTLFVISGTAYGWFLYTNSNEADRDDIEVMAPYFLYLLNPGDTNSLQFAVGNLHPGETKRTVICVSNRKPDNIIGSVFDIAKDSDFEYELEFVQTNNLEVQYDFYNVERIELHEGYVLKEDEYIVDDVPGYYFKKVGTKLEGKDTTEERQNAIFGDKDTSDIVNSGTYTLYSKYSNNEHLHLTYEADSKQYDYNYFMIEISWKEGAEFSENSKETDLLYVIVNAMQLRPEKEKE